MQVSQEEIDSLQTSDAGKKILEFNQELVPASHKALLRSLAHGSGSGVEVFPEDIRIIPGFNPRIPGPAFDAHVRTIADSIKERGFYKDKPIAGYAGMDGRKPVIFLTDGEVRYRATLIAIAEGALIETIPLVLKPEGTSREDLTVDLVRSNGGKPFTPLELSVVCARLRNYGWDIPKISNKLGITPEYVSQLLMLAGAPQSLRDKVASGEATAGVAIQAMRQHGSDAAAVVEKALDDAKAKGKAKITAKNLPEQIRKKAIVKAAPRMLTTLQSIALHEAFQALPDDLRSQIDALLKDIPKEAAEDAESSGAEGE